MKLLIFLPAILIPAYDSSNIAFHMIYSAYKLNKQDDNIQPWRIPFPIWNQSVVLCLVLTVASWPTYRFLRRQVRWSCIPISKNFPQFVVIHTVKGFGVVNKAEVDFFWNSLAFSMIQQILAIWSLVLLPFLNPAWTSGSSQFTYCRSLCLENLGHCFNSMWDECNCAVVWRIRWLDSIIDSMDMNLSKLQEIVKDRGAWDPAVHEVT